MSFVNIVLLWVVKSDPQSFFCGIYSGDPA